MCHLAHLGWIVPLDPGCLSGAGLGRWDPGREGAGGRETFTASPFILFDI